MNATFPMPVFTGDTPLYEQLYRHISAAIQSGHVAPGEKLPSKRQLCAALGVSMSTVEAAYSLLAAEGYVIPRPRSGYVAAQVVPLATDPAAHALPAREVESLSSSPWDYSFSTGAVDTSVFPFASWARITKEAVYQNPELLQRGHPQGDLPLREALADFLAQYRGVRCRPDQVIVGAGADYLLSLVLQLLPDQRDIALEDPGYPAAYATALHHQRQVVPIPVDAEGMDPDALDRSGARLAYVTPSHQFPLGVTMPAGRRSRLLQWAYAGPDRYLIEDDYDSEFRHTSRPIPAMQGVDRRGRVIYLGTFSRSIAPAIRVAYLILPPTLLERYRREFPLAASTVSRFEQEALRRFLVQGLYARHLRRAGALYRKKCARLTQALSAIPGAQLTGKQAGLHFLFTLPRLTEQELVDRAAARSVRVHPLSQYCHAVPPIPSTLVLGYAGLTEEDLDRAAGLLRDAYVLS